jgi:hypothetical protein
MFEDVSSLAASQMGMFSDLVRDEFGQSILTDVFEPILQDISCLQELDEYYQKRVMEIDQLTDELRSIGSIVHV